MSILNVVPYAHRIVIAVDTDADLRAYDEAGGQIAGQKGRAAKMFPLVHHPSIIAARGTSMLPATLAGTAALVRDFDTMCAQLTETIDRATAAMRGQNAALDGYLDGEAEIIVAGWSARRRRLVADFFYKPAGGSFTQSPVGACHISPPPSAEPFRQSDIPDTVEQHVAIARAQAERMRAEGSVAGGDLVIATLTRDGVNVEVVRGFA